MINNLRQLLASPADIYPRDKIIAYRPEGAVTWEQFQKYICAWELVLGDCNEQIIALYERDGLIFIAALIALWRQGKHALVPANNLPLTCHQLNKYTRTFAGDFPHNNGFSFAPLTDELKLSCKLPVPESTDIALILFTSGSTGTPEPVSKQFGQLEAELNALEKLWGARLDAASVITGSVSHQHIYGLLFRLLWPLCSGRSFVVRERDYWEELVVDTNTHQSIAIISSPAHLSRIPPLKWSRFPIAVYSSGAPLARETSSSAQEQLNTNITEVYGSTETGGIAWREQTLDQEWQCLPGVSVRCKEDQGLLEVKSAHLPDTHWFTTADRAAISPTGFSLSGRADRIAKVAGKRISLSSIEQTLEGHPWVTKARVIMLPDRGERLGAVLVLTHEGNRFLVDQGKNAINDLLKETLGNVIDRVAIPRYWRYLAELPCDRQGKTTIAELQQLFSQQPQPRLPELINSARENNSVQILKMFIPANLYYFEGHFPGRPILPGVVQTHWAVHYGRQYWDNLGDFVSVEALKFQQVVVPNQQLELRLEYLIDDKKQCNKLYFSYTSISASNQTIAHSSGRILFSQGGQ